jgi:acyl-coenzyme A thioesterase PaaI-like protein
MPPTAAHAGGDALAFLPNSERCFVCGNGNPCGLHVRFETDGETVWTTLRVTEAHMGYRGIVHGGVLTALLDETMGWAPAVVMKRLVMAVELNLELRRSVPVGEEITVRGWVTDASRRIWEGAGEIRGADGTLYVRGKGRFSPLKPDQAAEVLDYLQFQDDTLPPSALAPEPQ